MCLSLDLILDYWTIGPSQDFFSFVCKQVGKLFRMLIKERKLLQEHIAALWDAETASAAFEMVMQGDPINKWESDLCHCIMNETVQVMSSCAYILLWIFGCSSELMCLVVF